MAWIINYESTAIQDLDALDKQTRKIILDFINNRVGNLDNPRLIGHALTGEYSDYWSYRKGKYRIIARIKDNQMTILVVKIGKRDRVYR